MYLTLSKKPRKANRNKSKRYKAKLKAKDKGRKGRVLQGMTSRGKKNKAHKRSGRGA